MLRKFNLKLLKRFINTPVIGTIIKAIIQKKANSEAITIANHFSQFLQPVLATSELQIGNSFQIRHNVYCEELKFEPEYPDKQEKDDFDCQSLHCLIQHKATERYAGTVRIVCSQADDELLPLEKYCLDSIDHATLNPKLFPRNEICEISRLAVPEEFRRRKTDKFAGAATGAINVDSYSEEELRCFPFIAVGLYLSAASVVVDKGIKHVFVMMEPRLARSMRFVGIEFQQIGPVVEYHGKRAPYYIDPFSLYETLSPGFKLLFSNIEQQFKDKV